jgi:hypothetical protein
VQPPIRQARQLATYLPPAYLTEQLTRARDDVSAVAQQLQKIVVPPDEVIVQLHKFAVAFCGASRPF